MKKAIALMLAAAIGVTAMADDGTVRRERNYIVDGNRLYREERYADAEVAYKKALEINALNETALFNLAASYLRQGSATGENQKEAARILTGLVKDAENMRIAELAAFNLGNIAYNDKDYARSIEHYKNALRRNPDNDKARENLRLAQKKLEEQQQNQDQQQDKQDQQQNQDQQQQQQQNQDQNKDQQQDKDQQQQPQQQEQQEQQEQQQKQQGGISQQNAEQILKTMENEENATRQRVEAERRKAGAPNRRQVTKPW